MSDFDLEDLDDALTAGLAALATNGPPGLLERIAARWSRVAGPTCDLYIASTHLGVIYVRTSDAVHDDASEFATLFHHRFASPLMPAHPSSRPIAAQPPTSEPPDSRARATEPPYSEPPYSEPPCAQPIAAQPPRAQPVTAPPVAAQPSIPRQAAPAATIPATPNSAAPDSATARSAIPCSATAPDAALDHLAGLRLDLSRFSAFEREVLLAVLAIPRGQVRPHSWVAHQIGRPTAIPDIDITLRHNPVPILIPCHRVINADGTLGDHVFGPTAKRALLDAEGTHLDEVHQPAQRDIQ
ncbi:MAG TPA: methylated-DNA--[protein]-cysteine S-methyltransferase [Pseudonocardiaceae bacterium]|nr:methylated-DNA--[protein]-cysteine S-methyltransferase [Pseudonocardiaceae bacterium]